MTTVMVTACAAFGLTFSEAKTKIMCLQTKDGRDVIHRHYSRPDAQTNGRVCVLGRGIQRKSGSHCRGNASNPESMGVLRAV